MGRLDRTVKDALPQTEGPDEPLDFLDPLDEVDGDIADMEQLLQALHCEAGPIQGRKSSRRRLEERLEEMRLQHQISDFDFKI